MDGWTAFVSIFGVALLVVLFAIGYNIGRKELVKECDFAGRSIIVNDAYSCRFEPLMRR